MNNLLNNELKYHRSHLNDKDECYLLKKYIYNDINDIDYSVIIPVYNQEEIITKNINSVLKYTGGIFEIIIILDFCFDNTEKNIIHFLNNYNHFNNNLSSIKIFKQNNSPIFESSCDNIGFVLSKGKYCLEIQADMEMVENNYNLHLTKPFKILDNVLAVSGRCAHNLFRPGGIGKLGLLIENSVYDLNIDKNKFYTYETCNRGPLLFDRQKLKQLNYLDEVNYHQDNSDHDIMIRGYLKYNYICGYVPIDFKSPLEDGSTRKDFNNDKGLINLKYKQLRMSQHKIKSNRLLNGNSINLYKKGWKNIDPKIYNI